MDYQVRYDTYLAKYRYKTEALFNALKDDIVGGRLETGSRLPASRALAERYGLSRGTVNNVYDMLGSQGYVRSHAGSGTYVSYGEGVSLRAHVGRRRDASGGERADVGAARISEWGKRVEELDLYRSHKAERRSGEPAPISFELGKVDLAHFPAAQWNRFMYEQVRAIYDGHRGNAFETEGHGPLRENIAHHLRRSRGVVADPGDIVIVNGSQQAITLLVQLLINPGDPVIVENPHYVGIRRAVQAAGGALCPCEVDADGIRFVQRDMGARLLVTTSGRQFPTGAALSMERRLQLLQWAESSRAMIIEDDYDSEFRYGGRPLEPLKSLDRADRVAFVGTFSRTMMQDIRLGYAVLPKALSSLFGKAKQLYETHPSSILEQRALAAFMASGMYERHLRRMKRVYKRKSELLRTLLHERLGALFDVRDSDTGLHVFAQWKHAPAQMDRFMRLCEQSGVRFVDSRHYYMGAAVPSACFGFAHLDESELIEGTERLRAAAKAWGISDEGRANVRARP